MGFIKRNIELEEHLDSIGVLWQELSDSEYKEMLSELNEYIEKKEYSEYTGDEAFNKLKNQIPIIGFIFNAPKHQIFSIYSQGNNNLTYGYSVTGVNNLNREKLNNIECVITNKELSFACVLNHEWQAMCPELYIEKNV